VLPDNLVKKIQFEISDIDTELKTYKCLIDLSKIRNPDIVEITALSSILHSFYNGIENIFLGIAKGLDNDLPKGEKWHNDLLENMKNHNQQRNPVISEEVFNSLKKYMLFRHFFRHSYTWRLDWEEFKNLVYEMENTWKELKNNLLELIN